MTVSRWIYHLIGLIVISFTIFGCGMSSVLTPTATPPPTATRTPTYSPQGSAELVSITLWDTCQWDVRMELSGFTPYNTIIVNSVYTETKCATGEFIDTSWTARYPDYITNEDGSLTIRYLHEGTGSFHYTFTDEEGITAELRFSTEP